MAEILRNLKGHKVVLPEPYSLKVEELRAYRDIIQGWSRPADAFNALKREEETDVSLPVR